MEESKVQRALSPSFTVSGTTIGAEPRGRRRGTWRAGRDTNAGGRLRQRCRGGAREKGRVFIEWRGDNGPRPKVTPHTESN